MPRSCGTDQEETQEAIVLFKGRKMGMVHFCHENNHPRTAQRWRFQIPGGGKDQNIMTPTIFKIIC